MHKTPPTTHATAFKTAATLSLLSGPKAVPAGFFPELAPLHTCQTLFIGCLELEQEVSIRSKFHHTALLASYTGSSQCLQPVCRGSLSWVFLRLGASQLFVLMHLPPSPSLFLPHSFPNPQESAQESLFLNSSLHHKGLIPQCGANTSLFWFPGALLFFLLLGHCSV